MTLDDLEIRGEFLVPQAVFIVGGAGDDGLELVGLSEEKLKLVREHSAAWERIDA